MLERKSKVNTNNNYLLVLAEVVILNFGVIEFHEAALESYKSKKFSDTEHRMLCVVNTSLINEYADLLSYS